MASVREQQTTAKTLKTPTTQTWGQVWDERILRGAGHAGLLAKRSGNPSLLHSHSHHGLELWVGHTVQAPMISFKNSLYTSSQFLKLGWKDILFLESVAGMERPRWSPKETSKQLNWHQSLFWETRHQASPADKPPPLKWPGARQIPAWIYVSWDWSSFRKLVSGSPPSKCKH